MLEVGEKSSVWDTDLLRPRKSGALLGEFSSNELCNAYRRVDMLRKIVCGCPFQHGKQVSATANLPNMRAEHIPVFPGQVFPLSVISNIITPEVVLSVEVVEEAGGRHSGGERLVPSQDHVSSFLDIFDPADRQN